MDIKQIKRARVFTEAELQSVLSACDIEERALVLVSFRLGLRAVEMCQLDWKMIRTASGELADVLDLPPSITKGQLRGARMPIPADLRSALLILSAARRHPTSGHVFNRAGAGPYSADAIAKRLKRIYQRAGMQGSSHSGRRTLITSLAEDLNLPSLAVAARHRDLASTIVYIDPQSDARVRAAILARGARR